jgi:hypothetical protein
MDGERGAAPKANAHGWMQHLILAPKARIYHFFIFSLQMHIVVDYVFCLVMF